MKKNVIVCGLIAGFISTAWMFGLMITGSSDQMDFDNGMWIGYASMLLAFSLIFVAVKNFRDHHNGGLITFGKAFKIGLLVTLIASTVYVLVWLVDYFYFIPDFSEKYAAHFIEQKRAEGASEETIALHTKEMAEFSRLYKNPLFNALITYTEILPVGLLISLVAALILKRKSNNGTTVTG